MVTVDPLNQTIYERYGDQFRQAKQVVMKAERNAAVRSLLETITKELIPAARDPPGSGQPRRVIEPAAGSCHRGSGQGRVQRGRGADRPRADSGRQAA